MAITVEQRTAIIELVVGMFGAAPGASVLSDLVAAYEAGSSLKQIAANLAKSDQFKSIFPTFMTSGEFATKVVDQLVGSSVVAAEKTAAVALLTAQLNSGKSRSDVFVDAISALNAVASTNAAWGNAAVAFDNKVAAAVYYSVDKQLSGSSLAALQAVVSSVTNSTASLDAAKAAADAAAAPAPAPSQTFTLTANLDDVKGGAANDKFTGLLSATPANITLNALDVIDGGDGNDTLTILDESGNIAVPGVLTMSGVETVNVRSAGTANIDLTGAGISGVTTLNSTQSVAATLTAAATTNVNVSGATGAITINGGADITVSAATAAQAVTIGANTVGAGAVNITHTNQTTGAIAVDGGAKVTVVAGGATTGTVTVGQGGAPADLPTGAVSVTSTGGAYAAATAVTLGGITISGGSTVTVAQTAASASTEAAADGAAANRTQSAVSVTGTSATTEVSVSQSAPVTAVNAVAAATGVREAQSVTFTALAATETAEVNGLTFTAVKALTANEVAAAFANLTAGATHGSSPATNGIYSGTFNNALANGALMTSGAANGATVTFTEGTASTVAFTLPTDNDGAGAGAPVAVTTGVTAVTAVTGVMGVVGGAITVNGAIAGTDVLKTVSLTGFGAGSTVSSDALTALTLASSREDVTVTNAAASTLDLTLNAAGISTNTAAANLGGTYKTLNIKTTGTASDIDITAGGVETLTVSGTVVADLNTPTMGALKTITVSGSAGLSGNVSGIASVTSVDASATSGAVTVTIDTATAAYKGGTGVDTVTLNTVTITKDVSLGAGDDTLTLATGTGVPTGALAGGDGTDTLSMVAADAETLSAGAAFEAKFSGFEKIRVGAVAATQNDTIDLSNLNDISYVISAGIATNASNNQLIVNKMANGGTLEIVGAADASDIFDINLTDATGTADSLNVVTKVSTASLNFGTLDLAGIESVAITATDTNTSTITGGGVNTATFVVKDAALKTATVTGSSHLTLTLDAATTALTSLNASTLTGNLTTTTNGTVAQTVTGGSGADVLTAKGVNDVLIGGAGNDTLALTGTTANLVTLTGGAGADIFQIGVATVNVNSYATITDLAAGDRIQFSAGAATFASAKVSLGDTAVFQDYANAAIAATDTGAVTWFQIGGNSYVVENVSNNASTFVNGTDIIVRIMGAVDLSTASFSASSDTLLIA